MWDNFKQWLRSKTGTSSVVAGLIILGSVAYEAIPAFHKLIVGIVARFPGWLETVVSAIVALVLFYFRKDKTLPPATRPLPPPPPTTGGTK